MTRRATLGAIAAAPLARPALVRAAGDKPIKIGLLSDMNGPYREVGGPGSKVVAELAIEDIGGHLLGRPLEILQADCQNKPNVASAIARQWIDADGVSVLGDGAATSSGLGIQQVSREKNIIYLCTGPAATDFTGKLCSPVSFHFGYDTYALAKSTGGALTKAGGKTWFFITADYQFGYSLRDNTEKFVKAAGGKVLGNVNAPLGTADFSSYLIQAKSSGAQVIGFANAGTDLQNCLKQAAEFGIAKGGQKLATLLMAITDVVALGQNVCEGLVLTNSFYWNLTSATRAWAARFEKKINQPPVQQHAGLYSALFHWMKAVKATGTLDSKAVAAKMRATKVNDFYIKNAAIEPNGRVLNDMYLWQVKPPAPHQAKYDVYKMLAHTPGTEAFMPLNETGCPLVHT
ncbi:MAG: ABC transporter substrate-binding protein [Rhodospirillales bacterium]|nr:ABC transporter substrate-binding protein [Rhodospirillales bacterium]